MSKFLVTRGADANAKDKSEDRDDGGGQERQHELVGYLHENGAEVNAQNDGGWTALMFAAAMARPPRPNSDRGAEGRQDAEGQRGKTAADWAMAMRPPNHLRRHRPGGGGQGGV